jgi:hypothetical protein
LVGWVKFYPKPKNGTHEKEKRRALFVVFMGRAYMQQDRTIASNSRLGSVDAFASTEETDNLGQMMRET